MISVLGTGNMGKALVKMISKYTEEEILWGSRYPQAAEELITQFKLNNVKACSYEASLAATIIIPAFHVSNLSEWALENRDLLKHKVVVDISNPFNSDFTDFDLAWGESSSEKLQQLVPESIIVGAFKNTFYEVFEFPVINHRKSDVLVTSNDEVAMKSVINKLEPLPFRFIHAGKLSNNRIIERFTLLELEIANRYNIYPKIALQIFGIEEKALIN